MTKEKRFRITNKIASEVTARSVCFFRVVTFNNKCRFIQYRPINKFDDKRKQSKQRQYTASNKRTLNRRGYFSAEIRQSNKKQGQYFLTLLIPSLRNSTSIARVVFRLVTHLVSGQNDVFVAKKPRRRQMLTFEICAFQKHHRVEKVIRKKFIRDEKASDCYYDKFA